ncbi:MAG: hypothetical protein ACREEM_04775 [Blastocatellia bacterium]
MDAGRIWVGGIDLFRSDDGGANWGVGGNVYPFEGPSNIHPDQQAIVFHPQYNGTSNQTLFVGNDGGIYKTENARAAIPFSPPAACDAASVQVKWKSLNNNYAVTQFYHGTAHPDGKSYFGGTQDNGSLRGTDAAGVNGWREILGADGAYNAIDHARPDTLYVSYQGGNIYKSTDSGATFSFARFGYNEGGSFINPFIIDPSDSARLYIGQRFIWRTANGAASWQQVTAQLSAAPLSAMAVAPTDANHALVGFQDGQIIRTNRLLNLTPQSPLSTQTEVSATPRGGYVSSLAYDPNNKNIAYATYATFGGAHVWRTIDGGVTWNSIDGAGDGRLPDIPVHTIAVDPANTSRFYVGADVGVFVSTNGGSSWAVENTGFANVITENLEVRVINGTTWLYAFTHGRGVFKVAANMIGCNYAITPATRSFSREGGDAVINVKAEPASGCDWKAESNASWIQPAPVGSE